MFDLGDNPQRPAPTLTQQQQVAQALQVGSLTLDNDWQEKNTMSASTAGKAGFNLTPGAAPTSPVNGDVWTTTNGIWVRLNGVTKELAQKDLVALLNGGNHFIGGQAITGNVASSGDVVAAGSLQGGAMVSTATRVSGVTSSRNLAAVDNGKFLHVTGTNAVTLTVVSGLTSGFSVRLMNNTTGAGTLSLAASGTTLNGDTVTIPVPRGAEAEIVWVASNAYRVLMRPLDGGVDVVTESGTTVTLDGRNCGANRVIRLTSGSAVALNVAAGLHAGMVWNIRQAGTGVGTVTVSGGGTVNGDASTAGQHTSMTIVHVGSNTVDVEGGLT